MGRRQTGRFGSNPEFSQPRYWKPWIYQDGKLTRDIPDKYGPDICCDYLIDFMKANKGRPFLAYYPMILLHAPIEPTPDSLDDKTPGPAS